MKNKRIVLLACKRESTNIVYNSINSEFGIYKVLIEEKESTVKFLKRRIKKLGIFSVVGQVLFQILISRPLKYFSYKRRLEIISENGLDIREITNEKIISVDSVNSEKTINILKDLQPNIIIVHGTRIISKKALSSVECKFINIHEGITPKYRGVHGAYWALANNDVYNSGVTVHFVDAGIDTGSIISQAVVKPVAKDNFATYQLLQLSKGLELLKKAIEDFFSGKLVSKKEISTDSKLWYHPTIWGYLFCRVFKKVK